jgi:hypothetical protein
VEPGKEEEGGVGKSGCTFKATATVRTVEDVTVNEVEPKMKASLNYDNNNNNHRERKY